MHSRGFPYLSATAVSAGPSADGESATFTTWCQDLKVFTA
jgi:hypothetical protein